MVTIKVSVAINLGIAVMKANSRVTLKVQLTVKAKVALNRMAIYRKRVSSDEHLVKFR